MKHHVYTFFHQLTYKPDPWANFFARDDSNDEVSRKSVPFRGRKFKINI